MLVVTDSIQIVQRIAYQGCSRRFGDFNIGQLVRTVKYVDDLVLLGKEETVLQGVFDRLNEIGTCYGI
jgi:hypothetical protein